MRDELCAPNAESAKLGEPRKRRRANRVGETNRQGPASVETASIAPPRSEIGGGGDDDEGRSLNGVGGN